jgi:hypothetical protein
VLLVLLLPSSSQVARYISVGDDLLTLDKQRLQGQAMEQGVPLWGSGDGWDGCLPDLREHRKRIAGWKILGSERRRVAAAPAVDSRTGLLLSDEEFEEEVFGARLKDAKKEKQKRIDRMLRRVRGEHVSDEPEELEGEDAEDAAELPRCD